MKGDTLEFSTKQIHLRENATVQELLRHLPGVLIAADGSITINGRKVDRLLIDGEDFFGSSPGLITQNLDANLINKVQIMEKKSDMVTFTGIDDGRRSTVVNLTLRDDRKNGYFVKAEAGQSPDGYFNDNLFIGSFKGSRQLGVAGIFSNTGLIGLRTEVGGSDALVSVNSSTNDPLGASAGEGIPKREGLTMHYADKWNGGQEHFSGNANYGYLLTNPMAGSSSLQTLPDSVFKQVDQSSSFNTQNQQFFNLDYDRHLDSPLSIRASINGTNMKGNNVYTDMDSSSFNDTLANSGIRSIQSDVQNEAMHGEFAIRIRSRSKPGRSISASMNVDQTKNTASGMLYAVNRFFGAGGMQISVDTTNQRKTFDNQSAIVGTELNITEPLWKDAVLGASYGFTLNKNHTIWNTFAANGADYNLLIDSLSSHYDNIVNSNKGTLNIQGQEAMLRYVLGTDFLSDNYAQTDAIAHSKFRYHFFNVNPRAHLAWDVNTYKGFEMDYQGSGIRPSLLDLQPLHNNNDPLHISLGNPDLKSGFAQNIGISYHILKPVILRIESGFRYSNITIGNRTITDSLGRQISQPVNVKGGAGAEVKVSVDKDIATSGLLAGLNSSFYNNISYNYVNSILSRNVDNAIAIGGQMSKFATDKYSIRANVNFIYDYSSSSINSVAVRKYWTQDHTLDVTFYNIGGFILENAFAYSWRQKIDELDKYNTVSLWNMSLAREFMRHRLTMVAEAKDILGQNRGIVRSIVNNTITESSSTVLSRYYMLSIIFKFIKSSR